MRKAVRGRPLRQSEKRFNKLISKRRFRVEQCFGTMKRLFGLHRARYFGRAKTHAQVVMAAIGQNLLKAANKITLTPQTPAKDLCIMGIPALCLRWYSFPVTI